MMQKILVPLDGTMFGEHALPYALGSAQPARAALHLVHVHVPIIQPDLLGGPVHDPAPDALARDNEFAYLDGAAKRLRAVADLSVTRALLTGPVAECLEQEAQTSKAGLIVMTTHGRGPLSRFWLGSVADELVRHASVPILIVRPKETAPDFGKAPQLRHILIPLDRSPLAEGILDPAVTLGKRAGAAYTLLHVIDPLLPAGRDAEGFVVSGLAPAALKQLQEQAESYLARVAERLRPAPVGSRVVVATQAAEAILEAATELSADAIAIATHGLGGFRRLLVGSVADKVLRSSSLPVLVYRPLDGTQRRG